MKTAWFIGLIVVVIVISGCADKISSDRIANALNPTQTNPRYTVPEPQPSTPQHAEGIRDAKIVGLWNNEISGGPVIMIRYRRFYADGYFMEGSESLLTSERIDYYYDHPLDKRGIWSTDGENLRLDYDNGNQKVYKYNVDKYGLLLTTKGSHQLWEKE